jgi:hypothetical protein
MQESRESLSPFASSAILVIFHYMRPRSTLQNLPSPIVSVFPFKTAPSQSAHEQVESTSERSIPIFSSLTIIDVSQTSRLKNCFLSGTDIKQHLQVARRVHCLTSVHFNLSTWPPEIRKSNQSQKERYHAMISDTERTNSMQITATSSTSSATNTTTMTNTTTTAHTTMKPSPSKPPTAAQIAQLAKYRDDFRC